MDTRRSSDLACVHDTVGIDVPECLVDLGMAKDSTEVVKAVGDNALIVFYYFLQLREYTVKGKRNNTKQTAQLKL